MLLELVGRRPRRLQVSCGDRDRDARGEMPEPVERLVRVSECARDPADRGVQLALREPEQREPGLRGAAELVRGSVGLLGGGEVTPAPADLAELVVATGGDLPVVVVQLVARCDRLLLCPGEVTSQPHDLGPVEAARAREAAHVEAVAPAVRRFRPLRGPAKVAEVVARADRDAVDESGRVGAQLAAHRCRGRLVEQREPFVDLAALDQRAALTAQREHLDVAGAEPAAELERAVEILERRLDLPREELVDRPRQHQERVLGRIGHVGEQPLGRREPAVGDREGAAAAVVPGQRDREPRRAELVAARRERRIRTLAEANGLVQPPCPPRGVGELLEVGGLEPAALQACIRVVGRAPRVAGGGVAGGFERVEDLCHRSHIVT